MPYLAFPFKESIFRLLQISPQTAQDAARARVHAAYQAGVDADKDDTATTPPGQSSYSSSSPKNKKSVSAASIVSNGGIDRIQEPDEAARQVGDARKVQEVATEVQ